MAAKKDKKEPTIKLHCSDCGAHSYNVTGGWVRGGFVSDAIDPESPQPWRRPTPDDFPGALCKACRAKLDVPFRHHALAEVCATEPGRYLDIDPSLVLSPATEAEGN